MKNTSWFALTCLAVSIATPAYAQETPIREIPVAATPAPEIPEAAPATPAAPTGPSATLIDDNILKLIREKLNAEIVTFMISNQNEKYKGADQAKIDALDAQWKAERESDAKPLITATLTNPLSSYLTMVQAHSNGLFVEMFAMDNKGLNVGQGSISSDYWQGDEDKWQKTYSVGPDAIFIDVPEFDDEKKIWVVQVNIAIADPATGEAIGAATTDVNLTELQRRLNTSAALTF